LDSCYLFNLEIHIKIPWRATAETKINYSFRIMFSVKPSEDICVENVSLLKESSVEMLCNQLWCLRKTCRDECELKQWKEKAFYGLFIF
jgi:hypothetical protein